MEEEEDKGGKGSLIRFHLVKFIIEDDNHHILREESVYQIELK